MSSARCKVEFESSMLTVLIDNVRQAEASKTHQIHSLSVNNVTEFISEWLKTIDLDCIDTL